MTRKLVVLAVLSALVAGMVALPAEAAKKKKPKPVVTTLYMHGSAPIGEADGVQWFADGAGPQSPMTLDGVEPSGGATKSMNFFSPALNDQCTGLPLAFPTFTGPLVGTITGDAKMTLHFASAPANIKARIWADIGAFSACNDAYVPPASEIDIAVPGGQSTVEATFEGLNLTATQFVMIEILSLSGTDWGGNSGRLLYDSTSAPTSIEFGCIPASGSSCIPG